MSNVSGLIDNKSVSKIETNDLRLEGHLLKWKSAMIYIDNISMVTASDFPPPSLPSFVLPLFLVGLVFMLIGGVSSGSSGGILIISIGIILLGSALAFAASWWTDVEKSRKTKCLNILMNSGYTYSVIFGNEMFLERVLKTLENVFKGEINESTKYYINIKECKIQRGNLINTGTMNN